MNTFYAPKPFPAAVIPTSIRNAVNEFHQNIQVPYLLAFSSACSAAVLACQWHIRVIRLDGSEGPATLMFYTVAESGERKTTLDNWAYKPFYEHDKEQLTKYEEAIKRYEVEYSIWASEFSGLSKQLEKLSAKGLDTTSIKLKLSDLAEQKPKKPRRRKIIYKDVTYQELLAGMSANSPSVGVILDEAIGLRTGVLANTAIVNMLCDGREISMDRRTTPSITVKSPCFSASIAIQEQPFLELLEKNGDRMRGSGNFARTLFSFPWSTQGTRFRDTPTLSWEHVPAFQARIKELLALQEQKEDAGEKPGQIVLKFTPEAQAEMINAYNKIEVEINPGGKFADAKDYASKMLENTLRMAAIFHFFSGEEGDISLQTFRAAESIVQWYASEFVRLFAPADSVAEAEAEIKLLEDWFIKICSERGWVYIQKSFIRRYGPNALRNKERLDWVLACLQDRNRVALFVTGKTCNVELNMNYYRQFMHGSTGSTLLVYRKPIQSYALNIPSGTRTSFSPN